LLFFCLFSNIPFVSEKLRAAFKYTVRRARPTVSYKLRAVFKYMVLGARPRIIHKYMVGTEHSTIIYKSSWFLWFTKLHWLW